MKGKFFGSLFGFIITLLLIQSVTVSAHPGGRDELGGHFRRADCVYMLHSPTALAESAKNMDQLIALIKQNNSNSKCVNNLSASTIDLEGFTFTGGETATPQPAQPAPKPKPKAAPAPKPAGLQVGKKYPSTLEKCVDGDTAHFKINGKVYKTRFLYIDTPESTNQLEPYGKEAAQFTCDFISQGNVSLQTDGPELYDNYDRLLAWVWVGDKLHQEAITKEGLVEDFYDYGSYQYEDRVNQAMNYARENYLGMYVGNKPKEPKKSEVNKEGESTKTTEESSNKEPDKKEVKSEEAVAVSKEEPNAKEAAMETTAAEDTESSPGFMYFVFFMVLLLLFTPRIFFAFGIKPLIAHRLVAKKLFKNFLLFFVYFILFFITIPLVIIEWIRFIIKKRKQVSAI
ncbi:thermonuclease family protein [Fictibacillus barbaricus]|uniref:Thermonuclease family protein n=1 Tax=Fictibacillus barbaricus TaxID=182136 RepID=A0ABS2ZIG9_9BACL|nr:thermonuclease family protein [Fictibacillus barbaricus]MBN3547964.1 thermonuclease family protein [Fictibacillus barbaricus]GGB52922.1 hypothetical protein GCM10007199_18490 [Fictibacillus barbaricus]